MRLLAVVCGLAWATFVQENGIRDYKDARVELLREERRAGPSPRREARVCLTPSQKQDGQVHEQDADTRQHFLRYEGGASLQ